MEPKNGGFEGDFPFQHGDFQVPAVSFRGCMVLSIPGAGRLTIHLRLHPSTKKEVKLRKFFTTLLVGGFCPRILKNMRTRQIGWKFPQGQGWKFQKSLKPRLAPGFCSRGTDPQLDIFKINKNVSQRVSLEKKSFQNEDLSKVPLLKFSATHTNTWKSFTLAQVSLEKLCSTEHLTTLRFEFKVG